ncbi:DJ-1/PfpI family protein [Pseudonocardia endophytica]|uniref:DJ-1/PfpI family protein n=2 Tax=Pseudonocardia endophytica TaxID=401976 RepID=A0A4R1HL22_PSEEN|nr:DJ-1/PfpI family protein [Pseudonocardia endophytica]
MQIAIPLYPRLTVLDAVGPYEVLQRVPGFVPVFVGAERGTVRSDTDALGLVVDAAYDEVPSPDVVVVPGGPGSRDHLDGGPLVDWLRRVHPGTRYTTSVCTGSLVLGAAGLLDGLDATTHWGSLQVLERFGARPTTRRVVEQLDHRIVTAAGVSSGIDMGLRLIELLADELAARTAQLWIEYDPQPPFDSGHPDRADDAVRAKITEDSGGRLVVPPPR